MKNTSTESHHVHHVNPVKECLFRVFRVPVLSFVEGFRG